MSMWTLAALILAFVASASAQAGGGNISAICTSFANDRAKCLGNDPAFDVLQIRAVKLQCWWDLTVGDCKPDPCKPLETTSVTACDAVPKFVGDCMYFGYGEKSSGGTEWAYERACIHKSKLCTDLAQSTCSDSGTCYWDTNDNICKNGFVTEKGMAAATNPRPSTCAPGKECTFPTAVLVVAIIAISFLLIAMCSLSAFIYIKTQEAKKKAAEEAKAAQQALQGGGAPQPM